MSKKDMLEIIRLLAAIEAWSLVEKEKMMPEYLHETLDSVVDKLSKKLLEEV